MTKINYQALEDAELLGLFKRPDLEMYSKAFSKTFMSTYKILILVSKTSEKGIGVTHAEIAEYLDMNIMTIQPMIKWLSTNKFVEQIRLGKPGCPCYVYLFGSNSIPGEDDAIIGADRPLKQFLET